MQQLTIRRIGWDERIHRPTEVEEEEACWHATRTGDKENEHDEQYGGSNEEVSHIIRYRIQS